MCAWPQPRPISCLPPCHLGSPTSPHPPSPCLSLSAWLPMSTNQTQPGRDAFPTLSCPLEPRQPGRQGDSSCLAGPAPLLGPVSRARPWCPLLPASLVPGFSGCFGPHGYNLGKDGAVGASRAVPIVPGAWTGLWLVHELLTECCSLPPVHLSRSIYLRAEPMRPWWGEVLGFRLF